MGVDSSEPNEPLLAEGQILLRKWVILGVRLGHAQTCKQSIFSNIFTRGEK